MTICSPGRNADILHPSARFTSVQYRISRTHRKPQRLRLQSKSIGPSARLGLCPRPRSLQGIAGKSGCVAVRLREPFSGSLDRHPSSPGPVIPRQVALQRCPPPLHRTLALYHAAVQMSSRAFGISESFRQLQSQAAVSRTPGGLHEMCDVRDVRSANGCCRSRSTR